jgi:hypothetical protein
MMQCLIPYHWKKIVVDELKKWPVAFFGKYRLVFIEQGPYGKMNNRKDIIVKIGPKFE